MGSARHRHDEGALTEFCDHRWVGGDTVGREEGAVFDLQSVEVGGVRRNSEFCCAVL
jgi:hypothetical protein